MNFLKAAVVEAQAGRAVIALESNPQTRLTLPVADRIEAGAKVTLGIRPEHFVDAGAGDADLTVSVDVAEHLGNTSYIYAAVGSEQLIIERPESRVSGNRETLTVGLPANRTFLFDAAGRRLR